MAWPVVTVASGGIPVTTADNGLGTPIEEAANGLGTAVTFVSSGGLPVLGASSPAYTPLAVAFEGDTSLIRAAAMGTASYVGSTSFWLVKTGGDGVTCNLLIDYGSRVSLGPNDFNKIQMILNDGIRYFVFSTNSTMTAMPSGTNMTHICMSWDTNHPSGNKIAQVYRDGVLDQTIASDTDVAFQCDYTVAQYSFAAHSNPVSANPSSCVVKEFMFWPGVFIDWSNAANRAKVYSGGNPVDPGATGSLVTGTAPALYHTVKPTDTLANSFLTNRGSGGDLGYQAGAVVLEKRAVIGYGDSHIFGTGASNGTLDLMSKMCRGLSPPWHQLNFGVGGEISTAIKNRMVAAVVGLVALYPNAIWVLEGGYNNSGSPATVIADHAAMVSALLAVQPAAKYIGVSVWSGNVAAQRFGGADYANFTAIETGLKALYGARYADVWRYFVNKSASTTTSQAFIDSGLTPSAQDLTDLNDDIVPDSFRSDAIHLNDAGHNLVGTRVTAPLIQSLGWG